MNILIVDDNQTNRRLLAVTLQAEGHQVLHAANGAEALSVLGTQPVEAIICDVLMPVMDGYQFCHTIRGTRRFKSIPFVFYSSHYATAEGERFGKDAGADRYVHKPASTFSILSALYDVIREKKGAGADDSPASTKINPRQAGRPRSSEAKPPRRSRKVKPT